jgi:hypothetical protein
MADSEYLRARIEELVERHWDLTAIEARFRKFTEQDVNDNLIWGDQWITHKNEILDRIQRHAEEYCYLTRNCAKGSATALFEAFGLGNKEMIRALTPFPGLGMSGNLGGPVTGGLVAIGLYFSDDDPAKHENFRPFTATRKFIVRFEETFGSLLCPKVAEFILGRYVDPFASPENREALNQAGARERCPLAPGMGARIAAEIIMEDMEVNSQA